MTRTETAGVKDSEIWTDRSPAIFMSKWELVQIDHFAIKQIKSMLIPQNKEKSLYKVTTTKSEQIHYGLKIWGLCRHYCVAQFIRELLLLTDTPDSDNSCNVITQAENDCILI